MSAYHKWTDIFISLVYFISFDHLQVMSIVRILSLSSVDGVLIKQLMMCVCMKQT